MQAKKHNAEIVFTGNIPTDIDNVDLCILISNTIDNAIEACSKLTEPGIISVNAYIRGNYLFFEISNPVESPVAIVNNMIETTKEDESLHGIGLMNVYDVAAKYGGSVNLQCKDLIFTIEIVLKII